MKQNTEMIFHQSKCISHEIRNHLSICELYTEIIRKHLEKDGVENESVSTGLKCIKKSLKIMNNCLFDLKSLDNFKVHKCDLRELVNAGISISEAYNIDRDIQIESDIKTTATVEIDENKFLACMINIIKNANEAISENGIIKVSATVENNKAIIKISNNGKPISKAKQKQIFEEGFTTKKTGSGLGLYICKNNLEMQGAELKLAKSDEESTEFEIIIPIATDS